MKRKKYDLSTPAGLAMYLLDDPKWSWNKFPRRQISFITFRARRYIGLDLYHIARSTRRFFTGTYSNTVSYEARRRFKKK